MKLGLCEAIVKIMTQKRLQLSQETIQSICVIMWKSIKNLVQILSSPCSSLSAFPMSSNVASEASSFYTLSRSLSTGLSCKVYKHVQFISDNLECVERFEIN